MSPARTNGAPVIVVIRFLFGCPRFAHTFWAKCSDCCLTTSAALFRRKTPSSLQPTLGLILNAPAAFAKIVPGLCALREPTKANRPATKHCARIRSARHDHTSLSPEEAVVLRKPGAPRGRRVRWRWSGHCPPAAATRSLYGTQALYGVRIKPTSLRGGPDGGAHSS